MTLMHRTTLVGFSLLTGCFTTASQQSTNPDAGRYDDYYSQTGASGVGSSDPNSGDNGSTRPQPRLVTSSGSANKSSATTRELLAKRPPVKGGSKRVPPKRAPADPASTATMTGIVPSTAGRGSLVALYGEGLDDPKLDVRIGGTTQKIVERSADRIVFAAAGARGAVHLFKGTKLDAVSSPFVLLRADGLFGRPNTSMDNGLFGNVYAFNGPVTELPSFGDLGDPVAVIAVDDLNMQPGTLKQPVGGQLENFGVHFQGSLNVTDAGDYELCLNAGDGAQLYLDESLIVDNDGVHDTTEACEAVYIEAGEYKLDLLWFQADRGEMGLQLLWSKDGGEKTPVPPSALFPPDSAGFVRK